MTYQYFVVFDNLYPTYRSASAGGILDARRAEETVQSKVVI
jgi:hypothetical protein